MLGKTVKQKRELLGYSLEQVVRQLNSYSDVILNEDELRKFEQLEASPYLAKKIRPSIDKWIIDIKTINHER